MNNFKEEAVCTFVVPLQNLQVQQIGFRFSKFFRQLQYVNNDYNLSKSSLSDKTHGQYEMDFEEDVEYVTRLDPKEWKKQDHYAVLGLKYLRFEATEDDIRRAYRKMVLKHHPDKRKAKGEIVDTDRDYYTCITKAYEVLGNPRSRRSYDSVDPLFDDSLPHQLEIDKDFFTTFDKYFKLNARWSEDKNVPCVGDEHSTRDHVETFYNFWYDFESWREYSYLDEEDKEKGQDREERRWIEKQNKMIRIKRKKEEMSRIRTLVDLAYANDPRIQKFKEEEKQKKLALKRAKINAAQAQKAKEERILQEAKLAKEHADQAEQKRIEQMRLEKDQQRRALKKERKALRDNVKDNNYYSSNESEKLKHMEGVEKICETLKLFELQNFNKELNERGRDIFLKILKETEDKLEKERIINLKNYNTNSTNDLSDLNIFDKGVIWNCQNTQLLIKAVNMFPAGTNQRWEVIASFVNQHLSTPGERPLQARDVLNKAKSLQSSDFSKSELKVQTNEAIYATYKKERKELKKLSIIGTIDENVGSVNSHKCLDKASVLNLGDQYKIGSKQNSSEKVQLDVPRPWTKEEQAILEQAIKTYPISTPDRWDRIAESVPNRTKKDCLRRVKELVDRVNAKKEAQEAIK